MSQLDEWVTPDINAVAAVLNPVGKPWWIAGGLALDLFVGHETRPHQDVDVAVLHRHARIFRAALSTWDVQIGLGWEGEPGQSRRVFQEWRIGEEPPQDASCWCRPQPDAKWHFELLMNRSSEDSWNFKRDPSISLPLSGIGMTSSEGIPFFVPEIVLLYKATSSAFDDGDSRDFENTVDAMSREQTDWLSHGLTVLAPRHPWLHRLRS